MTRSPWRTLSWRCRRAVALSLLFLQPPPLLASGAGAGSLIRGNQHARWAMPQPGHIERAWGWWRGIGSPQTVCAPMVKGSELAFRLLVRQHGVHLTYTPMISAKAFLAMRSEAERRAFIEPDARDRPLIVQFCTNEPEEFLQAALLARACVQAPQGPHPLCMRAFLGTLPWSASARPYLPAHRRRQVQEYCDGVDLNLGCPKDMGRRYGAILMEEPEVVREIVRRAAAAPALRVPVTCKIRVWSDRARTVAFARMLQGEGCALLAVHGRERACAGEGDCDWGVIAAVKAALEIPVLANGGMVRTAGDADAFREATGADGVMSAVGLLLDPRLFRGHAPEGRGEVDAISCGFEYLSYAERVPTTQDKYIREHLQYLLRPLACPTHKGKHNSGTDQHADIWGFLTNTDNLRNALQARMLLEILAWRLGHPSVTQAPAHTLRDIKNLRSACAGASSDSDEGFPDLFAA